MWKDLDIRTKHKIIKTGVSNGLRSIKDISEAYNSFAGNEYEDNNNSIDIPYSSEAILNASLSNPNGGIFIGDKNIPKEDREYTYELPNTNYSDRPEQYANGGNLFTGNGPYYNSERKRWYREDGKPLMHGHGYTHNNGKVYVYNADGTSGIFTKQQWRENQRVLNGYQRMKQKRDSLENNVISYKIGYNPNRVVTLTTGDYRGNKVDTAVWDSIAVNAKKANLPLKEAMGLAGQETNFYNPHNGFPNWTPPDDVADKFTINKDNTWINNGAEVDERRLVSDWIPSFNPYQEAFDFVDKQGLIGYKRLEAIAGGERSADKRAKTYNKKYQGKKESALLHAFRNYKLSKDPNSKIVYNADPDYFNKVNNRGNMLYQDPVFLKWLNSSPYK